MRSHSRGTTILLALGLALLGATLPFCSFIYTTFSREAVVSDA